MGLLNKILGNASEVSSEKLNHKYARLLISDEQIEVGFTLFRDVFMFTKSLPYKNISRFSLETSGTFDLDAELKIWISSEDTPSISKKFNKSIDVYEVQKYLANKVM